MEIFDVFSMNGIENYPAAGEIFLENVILKVSQTHFPKDLYPKGGPMPPPWLCQGGAYIFQGGAVKYPGFQEINYELILTANFYSLLFCSG